MKLDILNVFEINEIFFLLSWLFFRKIVSEFDRKSFGIISV